MQYSPDLKNINENKNSKILKNSLKWIKVNAKMWLEFSSFKITNIYIQVFELDRFSLDIIGFSLDIISLDIMVHISEKEFETINGLLIK